MASVRRDATGIALPAVFLLGTLVLLPAPAWAADARPLVSILALVWLVPSLSAWDAIAGWSRRNRRAGRVLLDLGRAHHPMVVLYAGLSLVEIAAALAAALWLLPAKYGYSVDRVVFAVLLSGIAGVAHAVGQLASRLQLREGGVVRFLEFLPWEAVASFDLPTAAGGAYLRLTETEAWREGGWRFSRNVGLAPLLHIPADRRDEAEALLGRYVRAQPACETSPVTSGGRGAG